MCTILVAWRCRDRAPLLLAANRDELTSRPSAPPAVLDPGPPAVVGGRDLLGGGTWLAVAADGRVAAVTNRRAGSRDPARRSRGELPLRLLQLPEEKVDVALATLPPRAYNPFNVLVAGPSRLLVGHSPDGGAVRLLELPPGTHVLTVDDVDDPTSTKGRALAAALAGAAAEPTDVIGLLAAMEGLLRGHSEASHPWLAACVHADGYGTVSAASVVVWEGGWVTYRHADGPPCRTPFVDHSWLWARAHAPARQEPGSR